MSFDDNLVKEDVLEEKSYQPEIVDPICRILETKLKTPPAPEDETKAGLNKRLARFGGRFGGGQLFVDKVEHPNFDKLPDWSDEDLVQVWENVSEFFPSYKKISDSLRKTYKSTIDSSVFIRKMNLNKGLCDDLCTLAGVDKTQRKIEEQVSLHHRIVLEILSTNDLPKYMEITITETCVEVNGIPTKISGKGVEHLFLGLKEFMGEEVAIKKTASLIRNKLKKLY